MKRTFFLVISLVVTGLVKGQIAQWLIPPTYDFVNFANGADLIITDSIGEKGIWTFDGKRVATTSDNLLKFNEGLAISTKQDSATITGFYDVKGHFTSLPKCSVTYGEPYFFNDHLLVKGTDYFSFIDKNGVKGGSQYVKAYPFSNGYASCYTYQNLEKQKDPCYILLKKNDEKVTFSFNGKPFDSNDIGFISSVNDENIGFVVAKHKLYYFNGKDATLSPVYARANETDVKNQVKLDYDLSAFFLNKSDSAQVLRAKYGKNNVVEIQLNSLLVPVSIKFTDSIYVYKTNNTKEVKYTSPLLKFEENQKYGIAWEDKQILPPQLDDVHMCFDDKAIVKLSGKCGMLRILKDERFKLSMNKGDDIGFRHNKYETKIRLDLPQLISSNNARIEMAPNCGCNVDMTSSEKKDTEFGNYVQYSCVLSIPESLPDEMYGDERNEIVYPTQILYNGLKSPIIPFTISAWHCKYFNVDINNTEVVMDQGILLFSVDINADRLSDETVYPKDVIIITDSLEYELEKISETRYKCKISDLNEGVNNIMVQVTESGCPPALFPFEINYVKPVAKSKNKPEVKENISIKAKTKVKAPAIPKPRLDHTLTL